MKNFLAGVVITLAALVLLGAANKPTLTINGIEVNEIRFDAPLQSVCYGNGMCEIRYEPPTSK